jgi:hypothetical protein
VSIRLEWAEPHIRRVLSACTQPGTDIWREVPDTHTHSTHYPIRLTSETGAELVPQGGCALTLTQASGPRNREPNARHAP